jgi:glycosyltransferase involved in cell wall biosynthesis
MRISHVCSTIEREANGMSKAVLDITTTLNASGLGIELFTLGGAAKRTMGAVSVHRYSAWKGLGKLGVAPALRRALFEAVQSTDVIHSHGLWTFPPTYALQAALWAGKPTVVSAHGAFNPWAMSRSRFRKRVMWSLVQSRLFRHASCLHATSESEIAGYRRMGLTAPIAVIPLSVEAPDRLPHREPGGKRKLLFLGRVHPIKGVDLLLKAWAETHRKADDWELHIVGPGDAAYIDRLRALSRTLNCARVQFRGPVYGDAKSAEFCSADAFVLPSYSECFGLAVAEALAHSVPTVVTRGAPWRGLDSRKCGWWVEGSVSALAGALSDVTSRPPAELARMGAAGRKWMQTEYSMEALGRKFRELYGWITSAGTRPAFVEFSSRLAA